MSGIEKTHESIYEFMDEYTAYFNGIEYVPVYRVKQWFDHKKTEQEDYKEQINDLKTMARGYREEINNMRIQHERECAKLYGIIEGLKFSIRCNGVSGSEVK